jgi:large subunit ribosomal protein L32e
MADIVKTKKEKKARSPKFIRQDVHKKKRLASKWRKPRGCDSKKRLAKNNRIRVKPGYGTPNNMKNLDYNGKEIVLITKIEELENIDLKKQVVIVSGKIGFKNKKKIVAEIIKKKIQTYNIKDPEKYLKNQESKRAEIKKAKKKEDIDKKEKKIEKPKKEKESIEDTISEEDKKKIEKKEIDKLLTKKL